MEGPRTCLIRMHLAGGYCALSRETPLGFAPFDLLYHPSGQLLTLPNRQFRI